MHIAYSSLSFWSHRLAVLGARSLPSLLAALILYCISNGRNSLNRAFGKENTEIPVSQCIFCAKKPTIALVFRFNHKTFLRFIYLFSVVCLCAIGSKQKTSVSSAHNAAMQKQQGQNGSCWREKCNESESIFFSKSFCICVIKFKSAVQN